MNCVLAILVSSCFLGQDDPASGARGRWRAGDSWTVRVKQMPREGRVNLRTGDGKIDVVSVNNPGNNVSVQLTAALVSLKSTDTTLQLSSTALTGSCASSFELKAAGFAVT